MANNDFSDSIRKFADEVQQNRTACQNEEATKMSLILPLFRLLGYNVFDPNEISPEYTADVGTKKGEKVDYAIIVNGEPHILVECKACTEDLDGHASQLFRYFSTTVAKYGILTNGIKYRFYTDLDESNKMDLVPFLEVDMLNLTDAAISSLKKFTKEAYDKDAIFSAAEELKYSKLIKDKLQSLMDEPDEKFTRLILEYVYDGKKNQKIIEKYKPLIKKSFNTLVSDTVNSRISSALNEVKDKEETIVKNEEPEEESKIITTEEELEAFHIVRAILVEKVAASDIEYKDTATYFSVNFQGKVKKTICRLQLDSKKKYIFIPDESKEFNKYQLYKISDIYNFKDSLLSALEHYLTV